MPLQTADLVDQFQSELQGCTTQFRLFGKNRRVSGVARTVKTYEDNGLVVDMIAQPGNGAILIVDGGGSMRSALVGDVLAKRALDNGWSGILVYGAVRDIEGLDELDFHVKALGSNPWRSPKQRGGYLDTTVMFGEARFEPNVSHIYSDEDGIVVSAGPLAVREQ